MTSELRDLLEDYRKQMRELYRDGLMRENLPDCEKMKNKTISTIQELFIKKVEGMKIEDDKRSEDYLDGYNFALDDIIKMVREL